MFKTISTTTRKESCHVSWICVNVNYERWKRIFQTRAKSYTTRWTRYVRKLRNFFYDPVMTWFLRSSCTPRRRSALMRGAGAREQFQDFLVSSVWTSSVLQTAPPDHLRSQIIVARRPATGFHLDDLALLSGSVGSAGTCQ
jgi:hypothetical protein